MNFDDPRITAYALGELDSPEDRAAVEALLREHPELSAEIEETRSVADLLRRELHNESASPLTPLQREEVLSIAKHPQINGSAVPFANTGDETLAMLPSWKWHWIPSAVAASVVLTTGIAALWQMQQPRYIQVAVSTPVPAELPPSAPSQPEPAQKPEEPAPATIFSAGKTIEPTAEGKKEATKEDISRLMSEADNFEKTGRYDLAFKRSEQVLTKDPYNIPARKMQEEINKKRENYASAGANHTRSYMNWQVEKAWDRPVRKFGTTVQPTTEAGVAEIPKNAPAKSLEKPLELAAPIPAAAAPIPDASMSISGGATGSALRQRTGGSQVRADAAKAEVMDGLSVSASTRSRTTAGREIIVRRPPAKDFYSEKPSLGISLVAEQLDEEIKSSLDLAQREPSNTESYDNVTDNAFLNVRDNPLSTFSIDVDTASYSNVRRFLTNNQRPPKGSVRIEELVNYFPYSYSPPEGSDPFSCAMEVSSCPWKPEHRLVRVGLKGREIAKEKLPPSNLVILVDVSGSMSSPNKLPLVKESLQQLVNELREQDSVGIVVYAGSSGVVLEPTSDKAEIRAALERLNSGGSTNGAAGIQAAYRLAQRAFKKGGNNRVILATDGDFNVGVTSQSDLVELIQAKAKSGVFLSVLGFGMGNTKDSTMEKLADKGNGNYAYIDSLKEGRKVLVEQMAGTLFTIAKDVKIQVEFNPAQVGAYRLIGYENRILAKEDFNDDKKDAGEIGAGHTVTALYEVVPAGVESPVTTSVDPLKYQQSNPIAEQSAGEANTQRVKATAAKPEAGSGKLKTATELLTLKLRFKQPDGDKSVLREFPLTDTGTGWEKSSTDFQWAAAVASFGMLLRDSPFRGSATWNSVAELAEAGKGADSGGYRAEFLELIEDAKRLVPVTPIPAQEQPVLPSLTGSGKAASLIVPEFDVTDLPVLDAIDLLSQKSRELDPEKKGISLVFAGGNHAAQMKVSLRMRNTSVLETGKALASTLGLQMEEQGGILIFRPTR